MKKILMLIVIIVITLPVQYIWNHVVTDLINVTNINFLEALGVVNLSQLFFMNTTSTSKNKQ